MGGLKERNKMENIRKEYEGIVSELADRARLIRKEGGGFYRSIERAIEDGFYYTDDRAYVLAWALEQGLARWGEDIDWVAIEQNLADDIRQELEKE